MWTTEYKGLYINGYANRDECSVTDLRGNQHGSFKSLQAAKVYCTKYHNAKLARQEAAQ